MKTLKKFGLIVGTIFLLYFGVATFTYPTGVAAAVTDPWEAIQMLTFRIAGLEERVSELEARVARLEQPSQENWQPAPGELDKLHPDENYPYLVQLPPELEGKVITRYSWEIKDGSLKIEVKVKNLSDKTMWSVGVREIYKDINGSRIYLPDDPENPKNYPDGVVPSKITSDGWGGAGNTPPGEPTFVGIETNPLPPDFLNQLASIELEVRKVTFK